MADHPITDVRVAVRRLDQTLDPAAMGRAADRAAGLTDQAVAEVVGRAVPATHPRFKDVLETLKARRDVLRTVVEERWPGARPLQPRSERRAPGVHAPGRALIPGRAEPRARPLLGPAPGLPRAA